MIRWYYVVSNLDPLPGLGLWGDLGGGMQGVVFFPLKVHILGFQVHILSPNEVTCNQQLTEM